MFSSSIKRSYFCSTKKLEIVKKLTIDFLFFFLKTPVVIPKKQRVQKTEKKTLLFLFEKILRFFLLKDQYS